MSLLLEVSLSYLYDQTATNQAVKLRRADSVSINEDIKYLFLPPGTLIMRTEAYGDKIYNMTIIMNDVKNNPRGKIVLSTANGPLKITSINPQNGNAQVFCACTDFSFAYNRQNHNVDALAEFDIDKRGRRAIRVDNLRPPYIKTTDRPPRMDYGNNPGLCKHLIKFARQLKTNGVFGRNRL